MIKDSGERETYSSGMKRDTRKGKPDFTLLIPEGMPYEKLPLTRWAMQMTLGAEKYDRRNWEKANTEYELERFKESAFRHFMQWLSGMDDEDHLSACFFNMNAVEFVKWRLGEKREERRELAEEFERGSYALSEVIPEWSELFEEDEGVKEPEEVWCHCCNKPLDKNHKEGCGWE